MPIKPVEDFTTQEKTDFRAAVGAVGTASEITTALQGAAADDTRIGAEYMPEVLPVDLVVLSDTSAVIGASNALGVDGTGRLHVHDGKTTGGVPVLGLVMRGGVYYDAATDDNLATDHLLEIASVEIPPDFITTAGQAVFFGEVSIYNNLLSYATSGTTKIILYWEDQAGDPATSHQHWTIASGTAMQVFNRASMRGVFQFSLSAGYLTLSASLSYANLDTAATSGGAVTNSQVAGGILGLAINRRVAYDGTVSRTLKLGLLIPADAATADATGTVHAACDLLIQRTRQ